jgi:predicted branched-subunit amino acid permease
MKRFSSTTLKTAFVKSIPIFCSYVFVSMAYGMMMASAGFTVGKSDGLYGRVPVRSDYVSF